MSEADVSLDLSEPLTGYQKWLNEISTALHQNHIESPWGTKPGGRYRRYRAEIRQQHRRRRLQDIRCSVHNKSWKSTEDEMFNDCDGLSVFRYESECTLSFEQWKKW